jgi:hypothetical protein
VGRGVTLWAGSIVHTFNAIRRDLEEIDLQGATAEQEALAVVTP